LTFGKKTMNSIMSNYYFVGAIAGVLGVTALFVFGAKKKLRVKCPKCGTPFPSVRIPKSYRQFMWGGWTCAGCREEFDKWLVPVPKKK